ncbi:hypothetical protein K2173_001881 [Erythroxylum novogranatense]|uniref:SANTA domain-containing protein n=1 Tax=Erythroxylum novogranatense TaxID=1862640 RepID=A0AAV8SPJ6_9ROSI|nr:hypothetical protein K2173_001881 [Erythroxylum novogranatense]
MAASNQPREATTVTEKANNAASCSYFQKTVSLHDWWLIKADEDFEGKKLAVAGFTSGEQQALRVFHSAPITKRFDVFTIETADGVTVIFQGLMNKTRTLQNGFSSEVLRYFLLGFPPHWEECAKKCFEQMVNSGTDWQELSDINQSVTDTEVPVLTGEDSCLVFTPSKDKKEDNHDSMDARDSYYSVSKNINIKSSESVTTDNDVAICVQGRLYVNTSLSVLNDKLEPSILHKEYGTNLSTTIENVVDNVDSDARVIFPPSFNSSTTAGGSSKDFSGIQVELSSYDGVGSPETSIDLESNKNSQEEPIMKSKTNEPARLCCAPTNNNASEECLVYKGSNTDDHGIINLKQIDSTGIAGLTVFSGELSSSMKQQENLGDKDGLKNDTAIFSITLFSYGPEPMVGFTDENREILEDCLPGTPDVADSANHPDMSNKHPGPAGNGNASHMLELDKLNDNPNASCPRRSSRHLSILTDKRKSTSGCLFKHKDKNSKSEMEFRSVEKRKKTSLTSRTQELVNVQDAMKRAAKSLINFPKNLESNGKKQRKVTVEGGSSMKKAKRKISFDPNGGKEKSRMLSPESLSLKRSRSGRLLLPTLDFWRNQIPVYDANRNITGIREEVIQATPCRGWYFFRTITESLHLMFIKI